MSETQDQPYEVPRMRPVVITHDAPGASSPPSDRGHRYEVAESLDLIATTFALRFSRQQDGR